ncbi:MAG: hypothetical protein AB1645_07765 [Bacillota bacterium]
MFSPFVSLLRTLGLALTGRIRFPRGRVGETVELEEGHRAVVFREVVVRPGRGRPEKPGATFRVRFRLAGMGPRANKVFSLLPIPFFVGFPGFRGKLWLYDDRNDEWWGLYQWDTPAHAERYARSFAVRFMTRRSVPGSVSWNVLPRPTGQAGGPNSPDIAPRPRAD